MSNNRKRCIKDAVIIIIAALIVVLVAVEIISPIIKFITADRYYEVYTVVRKAKTSTDVRLVLGVDGYEELGNVPLEYYNAIDEGGILYGVKLKPYRGIYEILINDRELANYKDRLEKKNRRLIEIEY